VTVRPGRDTSKFTFCVPIAWFFSHAFRPHTHCTCAIKQHSRPFTCHSWCLISISITSPSFPSAVTHPALLTSALPLPVRLLPFSPGRLSRRWARRAGNLLTLICLKSQQPPAAPELSFQGNSGLWWTRFY